jgi:OOP family OmpA-OmpF porin
MRKFVAPVLCTLMMAGAAAAMTGCTVQTGSTPPPADPVQPPPPPEPEAKKEEPPKEEPKQEFKMEGNKLVLPGAIVYKTGSAELDPVSEPVLETVKAYLDAKPKITLLRIEGHTDDVGDAKKNLELSVKRSQTVAKWLVGKGIDCKRLLPVGFGQTKPVADNKTPEGKAQNRRTDFINASLSGKPIGGMPIDGGAPKSMDACTP